METAGNEKSQLDKFKDLAHELDCDEDIELFSYRIEKVANAKPKEENDD